jgi:hypothetical protein
LSGHFCDVVAVCLFEENTAAPPLNSKRSKHERLALLHDQGEEQLQQ